MDEKNTEELSYIQLSSSINPSFWNKFTELKLDVDKLNEVEHHIWGYFNLMCHKECNILEVDSTSFNEKFNGQNMYIPFHGKLINKNTIEQFKECNKTDLINIAGKELLEMIKNETVLKDPSVLNCFFILSFADLKKYHYYYWFAFPVPKSLIIWRIENYPITKVFSEEQVQDLCKGFRELDDYQKPYFLIKKTESHMKLCSLQSCIKLINLENRNQFYFVFYNIATSNSAVGPQLKNYVTTVLHYCPCLQRQSANFISLRLNHTNDFSITCSESIIYKLQLPTLEDNYNWVGWEKNERDKMGPRLANMKNTLDPYLIAENSVDLNLKLMKWRVLPDINLDKIKMTKCLILGSGTLGCSVARVLLAWGIRNITFVDNSTVSFSNPVRQSLFTYLDSVQMKPKALAAAENLKTIFPGVKSQGTQLSIPMPGHTVGESLLEQTKESVDKLRDLIEGHDIIFLLMDSRESRWLPTLLASYYNKITVNAALGFDTYLVMRHGVRSEHDTTSVTEIDNPEGIKSIVGSQLGCYFCNDVTAPGNSLKDRTLDQQCTVTRPGVSQIAGALAAELAISIIQHKDGGRAPAFYKSSQHSALQDTNLDESLLGVIPHSVRGFLSSFEHILPAVERYKHCIACSDIVLNEYKENGINFLLKVFDSSKHLEDVAQLTELFGDMDFGDALEFSDEDFLP